jgi:hypothetical protein
MRVAAVLAVLAALAAALVAWVRPDALFAPSPERMWAQLLSEPEATRPPEWRVVRRAWPETATELLALLDARQPVVFSDSPAERWAARRKWTPEYLRNNVPKLENVQLSAASAGRPSPVYEYFNAAPMAALATQLNPAPRAFERVNMTAHEFFAVCLNDSDPRFVYYAGNLGGGNAPVLLDLSPPSDFHLDALAARIEPRREPVFFVWVGKRGVTAHAHIDADFNLYVQLFGRKRFVLFPPRAAFEFLFPYPKLHPSNGQSQIDFARPQAALFPEFFQRDAQRLIAAAARVVDLAPGDVLYLPPQWLHYVVAQETSISVSMWVRDETVAAQEELARLTLPMRRTWGDAMRWTAAAHFIVALLQRTEGADAPHHVVLEHLLSTRYRQFRLSPLFRRSLEAPPSKLRAHGCVVPAAEGAADALSASVERARALLDSLRADAYIRRSILLDVVELTANAVVGTDNVYHFLEDVRELCAAVRLVESLAA